jgi:hypothetical protein
MRPGLAIQPSANRAARSMAGGALAPIQTSTGSAGRNARLASAIRNRRAEVTVSPASMRRTPSRASSKAEVNRPAAAFRAAQPGMPIDDRRLGTVALGLLGRLERNRTGSYSMPVHMAWLCGTPIEPEK